MSEPRLTIRNVATKHLLYVGRSWKATTSSENEAGTREALFKVQWCEQINGNIVMTVLIRTDTHPQSLLDVRDLNYQGGALDSQKCYDKNRWWKLTWIEVSEMGMPTVLFQSYTKKTYLAEKKAGAGLEVISLTDRVDINRVPDRAKWELTLGGRAMSPGQVTDLFLGIPKAIMGAFPGGAAVVNAVGPMTAVFTASGTTTLKQAVATTSAIAAGEAVDGIPGAARNLLPRMLKDVSKALFVDW